MGCSSSTQTHTLGTNKPPAKIVETNGPKKCPSLEGSDEATDDLETIPDQTKLGPLTEIQAASEDPPTADDQDEVEEATECDGTETTAPASEEEPEPVTIGQDDSAVEGDIDDAEEAKMDEEITSPEPETIEGETGAAVDAGEAEINTENVVE